MLTVRPGPGKNPMTVCYTTAITTLTVTSTTTGARKDTTGFSVKHRGFFVLFCFFNI